MYIRIDFFTYGWGGGLRLILPNCLDVRQSVDKALFQILDMCRFFKAGGCLTEMVRAVFRDCLNGLCHNELEWYKVGRARLNWHTELPVLLQWQLVETRYQPIAAKLATFRSSLRFSDSIESQLGCLLRTLKQNSSPLRRPASMRVVAS